MLSDFSEMAKQRRTLATAAQIVVVSAWIGSILILVPTFLNFLVQECEAGTPRLTAIFVCFPSR